ncbi:MAG TPA: hypothetical protein VGA84_02450 [Thermoanaerobaculia bacterium]
MAERRRTSRVGNKERRHPLRSVARLRPSGPALDRRTEPREERERVTVKLPVSVLERLRSAVFHTPGLTVTGFVERCILDHVALLEKKRGEKFPAHTRQLRPGRPRSTK